MTEVIVKRLEDINDKSKEVNVVLNEFINDFADKTKFNDLNHDKLRERLWNIIFSLLDKSNNQECKLLCLTSIKMLSREKTDLDTIITQERLNILLKSAELQNKNCTKVEVDLKKVPTMIEASKCLCNIVYNFSGAAQILNSYDICVLLCNRIKLKIKDRAIRYTIKLFDMKLMFLLTALCESARVKLYKNGNALKFFIDLINEELKLIKNHSNDETVRKLTDDQHKFCCELLKTFFNILMSVRMENSTKQKEVVCVMRDLLLLESNPTDLTLDGHVINLLTLLPVEILNELMVPGYELKKTNLKSNPGLAAVSKIVNYLDVMLTETEGKSPIETLSPVLLVLLHLAQANSFFRKYIKMEVLPNLREVHKRPEEGNSLRSRLCRLLTSPMDSVREPVADLLFTLCREDVGRMVKYTGYGNSAGLFARRGLVNGPLSYSSDSDSDTEEYSKHKDEIDPVLGCLPGPKDNSIEEMTEEQKEYLAVELANKIDKLQRDGLIQPCTIGADGKPKPIEHVLQLQMQGKLNISGSNGS